MVKKWLAVVAGFCFLWTSFFVQPYRAQANPAVAYVAKKAFKPMLVATAQRLGAKFANKTAAEKAAEKWANQFAEQYGRQLEEQQRRFFSEWAGGGARDLPKNVPVKDGWGSLLLDGVLMVTGLDLFVDVYEAFKDGAAVDRAVEQVLPGDTIVGDRGGSLTWTIRKWQNSGVDLVGISFEFAGPTGTFGVNGFTLRQDKYVDGSVSVGDLFVLPSQDKNFVELYVDYTYTRIQSNGTHYTEIERVHANLPYWPEASYNMVVRSPVTGVQFEPANFGTTLPRVVPVQLPDPALSVDQQIEWLVQNPEMNPAFDPAEVVVPAPVPNPVPDPVPIPDPGTNPDVGTNPNPVPQPEPLPDLPTDPPGEGEPDPRDWGNKFKGLVTTKFPFSLPWDLYAIMSFLNAQPAAPYVKVDKKLQVGAVQMPFYFEYDFKWLDSYMLFFRTFLVIGYCFYLINATRRLLGGAQ